MPFPLLLASQVLQLLILAHGSDGLYKIIHGSSKLHTLGGGNPLHTGALPLNAQKFQHREQKRHSSAGIVISGGVVAVAGVAAAENHTVRASLKGPQNEHRVKAAGAGNPNDFYVRGILQPIGAGQVGTGIAAPVATERNDGGRPFLIYLHIASTSAIICLLENP